MSKKHISFDGTPNFRDLGGYQSRCGRTVDFGRLYRCGQLSQLSDRDLLTLQNLNVGVICDFRREEEVKRDPSRLPELAPPRIIPLSIDPGSLTTFSQKLKIEGLSQDWDMAGFMVGINKAFVVELKDKFSRFLQEVVNLPNDQALVFHCAAGKDRTGFAAALVLMCLNVPRAQIEHDYMLTEQYFIPEDELPQLTSKYADYGFDCVDSSVIRPMLEVRLEYIRAAFNVIDAQYNKVEDYLLAVHGLDDIALERIRDRFLVEAPSATE